MILDRTNLDIFTGTPTPLDRVKALEEEMLASPVLSPWLKNAIAETSTMDQVDALRDAQCLVAMIERRIRLMEGGR